MIGIQVVQFSARMRHASGFDHPAIEERLVSGVVVADEFFSPVSQELARMHSAATVGKVVNDRLKLIVFGGGVTPEIRSMRAAETRL